MGESPDEESAIKELLYPSTAERTELQWVLIHKIYSILIVQILLTIAVASVAVFIPPVTTMKRTVLCPLQHYHKQHPVNLLLLGLFTVAISFVVGLTCAITSGKVILTAVVVVSLTIYTFREAKRGHDFGFLLPFLSASLMALIVFGLIQVFFPLEKITTMVCGGVAALLFCAYIVSDTDDLIKKYSYDEYIWASVAIYLDISIFS